MSNFKLFLDSIPKPDHRERMTNILDSIKEKFPQLNEDIKWNQPMFSDHGTFIMGFSVAKEHIAVTPESVVIDLFKKRN